MTPDVLRSAVAGNSGCFTVDFRLFGTSLGGRITASLSGDLEGTVLLRATGVTPTPGRTLMVDGIGEWDITGGVIGPLSFTTDTDLRNVLLEPGLFKNLGRHTVLSGLETAKLTFEGASDFRVEPNVVDWTHHGMLCP